jgi:hypothetical protein
LAKGWDDTSKIVNNKKPPAAFAGGGLFTAQFRSSIRQAPFPAHALWPLIRIVAGMIALAQESCMTMVRVNQGSAGGVKEAGRNAIHGIGQNRAKKRVGREGKRMNG